MHQAVSCRSVAEQALAQSQTNSRKICGGRSGNGIFFLLFFVLFCFPLSVSFHQYTMLIHSFIHSVIHSFTHSFVYQQC
jgi:hypothetical protein